MKLNFFKKKKNVKTVNLSSVYSIVNDMIGLNYPSNSRRYNERDYQFAKIIIRPISDAINKIADHSICIEPKIFDKLKNEYIDFLDFSNLISPPNPFFDYKVFIKTLVINYLTYGNAYYIISYMNDLPISLTNVSTTDITIEKDINDGWPSSYRICSNNIVFNRSIKNGKIVFLSKNDQKLGIIRDSSIKDNWQIKGESKIQAIMADIDLFRAVYIFNQSLLDKQGTPSGILKLQDNQVIDNEQRDHMIEQFTSQYAGAKNAGQNMILPPGIDYEQISLSPKDIGYGQILDVVSKGVYNTFNIPLSLIESSSLSLANMEVAMSHFYINAVIPVVKTIFSSFTKEIIPYFLNEWQNVIVSFDEREITALRGVRLDDLIKEASLNVLTIDEIRASLNKKPVPGGDEIYAPSDLIPISDVGSDQDDFINK